MFFFDFLILLVFFCCMGCERTTEKIIRDLNCKSAIETENGKTMDEELSEEELLHFNKMFFTQSQEENPYVRCLTSLYHDPKDMNIFLAFYGGSDSAKVTDENERERVMGAYNQEGTLLKISKTKMNEFLMRYIGLPVDETNKNGIELFEYDSGNYYYQTDFYPESRLSTTFLRGEHTDNKVRLYYYASDLNLADVQECSVACVTLEKNEQGYQIISNVLIPIPMYLDGPPNKVIPLQMETFLELPLLSKAPLAEDCVCWYAKKDVGPYTVCVYRILDGRLCVGFLQDETTWSRRNLFPRWKPGLGNVLACCDIFQIILEAAYEKYVSAANQNNQNYQEIARLGYVSKAYLVLAAIGTSGGALNLLAQMLINQANQYEADQRISFFRRHPDIDTFVQQHAAPYGWPLNDNYALAYRVLQSVCGIQRGSQPYSHMKKAELVLKGYVSESSSTQLTSLNIAINGGLAMGHYWKGRLLLEQAKQDHDRCNDYKDAAIASFCATNVTERFDHLPENADEDAAPQLSPPQWLSAIELLRYPDRAVFRVDRRMVFQTIYQKLTQQVEEVQSDNIQIHNERYRLTKKDVRSNLERCLDMVKAQFPDKEPLIQKMIRSIR